MPALTSALMRLGLEKQNTDGTACRLRGTADVLRVHCRGVFAEGLRTHASVRSAHQEDWTWSACSQRRTRQGNSQSCLSGYRKSRQMDVDRVRTCSACSQRSMPTDFLLMPLRVAHITKTDNEVSAHLQCLQPAQDGGLLAGGVAALRCRERPRGRGAGHRVPERRLDEHAAPKLPQQLLEHVRLQLPQRRHQHLQRIRGI